MLDASVAIEEKPRVAAPVRVLYVPVIGAPAPMPIDPNAGRLEQLVGGPLRPLPVGSSDRLALYMRDDTSSAPVNLRASRAFGADIRGNVVLAALRPLGALDSLLDDEVALWSYRAGAL
jgi:hypothetical protein